MNYLAHLYLARESEETLIGGFLGDFVKGSFEDAFTSEIRQGIRLHRRIDSYTDAHPIVLKSRRRIGPGYRHLHGILIDVFYDHFLAVHWRNYSPVSLSDFADSVYRALRKNEKFLTSGARSILPRMAAQNWLASYDRTENIERALLGISSRLSRPNNLHSGIDELVSNYRQLEQDFLEFFPDVIDFATRTQALGEPHHENRSDP